MATMHAAAPTASLIATASAATAAAVAPAVVTEPGFVLYVILGVVAGTIWRARYWFTEAGFQRRPFVADVSSMGALAIGGFGVCDYFALTGWTAGTVAVFASVIGVEPIRKILIGALDLWAKQWAGRKDGQDSGAQP